MDIVGTWSYFIKDKTLKKKLYSLRDFSFIRLKITKTSLNICKHEIRVLMIYNHHIKIVYVCLVLSASYLGIRNLYLHSKIKQITTQGLTPLWKIM